MFRGIFPPSGLEIKLWVLPITLPEVLIHHAVHDQNQITAETGVELPWWSNTSDAEPFGSQALQVGFDELSAGILTILHDAVVSQLLCIWASAADLLFRLRLRCRSCCGRLLRWIWSLSLHRCSVPHIWNELKQQWMNESHRMGNGCIGNNMRFWWIETLCDTCFTELKFLEIFYMITLSG